MHPAWCTAVPGVQCVHGSCNLGRDPVRAYPRISDSTYTHTSCIIRSSDGRADRAQPPNGVRAAHNSFRTPLRSLLPKIKRRNFSAQKMIHQNETTLCFAGADHMGTSWYVGGAEGLTRPWAGPLGRSRHSAAESSTAPKRLCVMGRRDLPAESVGSYIDRQCM